MLRLCLLRAEGPGFRRIGGSLAAARAYQIVPSPQGLVNGIPAAGGPGGKSPNFFHRSPAPPPDGPPRRLNLLGRRAIIIEIPMDRKAQVQAQ